MYNERVMEGLRKEARQRIELEHQRKVNKVSSESYRKVRAAQVENQERFALIKQQEAR